MKRTKHAQQITQRFREMVEQTGDNLSEAHYSELSLLIEAGIDTALVEKLEAVANKVDDLSHAIRNDAELFN
ncbi:MAG TPA: hypothetical protein ENJ08_03420 [Gammaproteobacteria bacterium]|nr:hypothetical protein [Gammaproteobacteria bacterium]